MQRVDWIWPAQAFLDDLVLIYPVYAIMMQEAGVDALSLSGLLALWSLAALVFEVPSGVIGDRVNRKRYVSVGSLVKASGYLVWLAFPSVAGFATGFVLWALGGAIRSGTLQALLFELLDASGRAREFPRLYGRGRAAEGAGAVVAMTLGGYAAESGYTFPLVLSAAAPLASAALVLLLPWRRSGSLRERDAFGTLLTPLADAVRFLSPRAPGARSLAAILAMSVLVVGVAEVLDEFVGLLLRASARLTLGEIGVLYAGAIGAHALGSALGHRLPPSRLREIGLVGGLAHALLCVSMAFESYVLAAALGAYFLVMGALTVALAGALQARIEGRGRATVTSIAAAALEGYGILLYLAIGFAASRADWQGAFAVVAGVTVAFALACGYAAGPTARRNRS